MVRADDVKIYHLHTPFNPLDSIDEHQGQKGGNVSLGLEPTDGKRKYVSYDTALGRNPGTTTCTSCQQQVTTNVTYKAGTYAWLMCLLFICCGLVLCCCLIPFFMNNFKDAHHSLPPLQQGAPRREETVLQMMRGGGGGGGAGGGPERSHGNTGSTSLEWCTFLWIATQTWQERTDWE
ncbi:hypothetical protein fugu_015411 [Takifugu bimaculatus]|uniref:LITAF domain-containing protein n=1 Tax=Takifugu bimaculatus TaxID=433685 RepID=A0A4Z2BYK8_9TELE|nr:hypothetical protein fugu_015411 [Takifugu bimaculatus]